MDHLKDVHKDVVLTSQRKLVREATGHLQGMYRTKEEMQMFRFPSPGDKPIPYIQEAVSNGNRCDECGWITTSVQRKRAHCQKEHPGNNGIRWRINVRCQRLFAKGPYSVWFEVGREEGVLNGDLTAWLRWSDELRMYGRELIWRTVLRMSKQAKAILAILAIRQAMASRASQG